ncbi:MAG: sporulation transcriptional regulator SpoIIID [Ruminococcaceae bacterium]|nr:sporulation transcriptional regulator SpoIIID [Oscillospiraceae bacterium]
MNTYIEERTIQLAEYIIEYRATVRDAAKKYGVSKSTVHKDVTERLERLNRELFLKVGEILAENKSVRHIRGGMATKEKYLKKKIGLEQAKNKCSF